MKSSIVNPIPIDLDCFGTSGGTTSIFAFFFLGNEFDSASALGYFYAFTCRRLLIPRLSFGYPYHHAEYDTTK